jgi:predicted nucleotide-binding protein (sugar kinase/HSP70/actin superfamily)
LPYEHKPRLAERLYEELTVFNLSKREINKAVDAAWQEEERFKDDVQKQGEGGPGLLESQPTKGCGFGRTALPP